MARKGRYELATHARGLALMDNFTAIRNGLLDHALAGKLSPVDFGLYVFLIMRANYSTGIYEGCALTIACQFGDPSQKEHLQKSLRRLRDKKYLNYRNGDGRRGAYPILINKFDVTVGELSGMAPQCVETQRTSPA